MLPLPGRIVCVAFFRSCFHDPPSGTRTFLLNCKYTVRLLLTQYLQRCLRAIDGPIKTILPLYSLRVQKETAKTDICLQIASKKAPCVVLKRHDAFCFRKYPRSDFISGRSVCLIYEKSSYFMTRIQPSLSACHHFGHPQHAAPGRKMLQKPVIEHPGG